MPTLYLYMSCSALLRFLSRTIFLNSEILASASKSRYRCLNGVIGLHAVSVGSVTLRSHWIFSPLQFADCREEMAVRRSLSSSSSGRGRRLQKHSEGRTPKGFARSHSTANWRGRERSRSFQRNTVCVCGKHSQCQLFLVRRSIVYYIVPAMVLRIWFGSAEKETDDGARGSWWVFKWHWEMFHGSVCRLDSLCVAVTSCLLTLNMTETGNAFRPFYTQQMTNNNPGTYCATSRDISRGGNDGCVNEW